MKEEEVLADGTSGRERDLGGGGNRIYQRDAVFLEKQGGKSTGMSLGSRGENS